MFKTVNMSGLHETVRSFVIAIIPLFVVFCIYAFYKKFVKPGLYWKIRGVYHVNLYHRFVEVFLSDASFLEVVRNAYEIFPNQR